MRQLQDSTLQNEIVNFSALLLDNALKMNPFFYAAIKWCKSLTLFHVAIKKCKALQLGVIYDSQGTNRELGGCSVTVPLPLPHSYLSPGSHI
jgi:hypothetical protein